MNFIGSLLLILFLSLNSTNPKCGFVSATHQCENAHLSVVWGIHSLWKITCLSLCPRAGKVLFHLNFPVKDYGNLGSYPSQGNPSQETRYLLLLQ